MTHTPPSIRPQDDLFRAVNDHWLRNHEIPADRPSDGPFYQLRDAALEQVKTIIEMLTDDYRHGKIAESTQAAEEDQQIIDLYASFMDTETIEKLGKKPIEPLIHRVEQAQTIDDIFILSGEFSQYGVNGLIGAYVATDAKKITHNALYLHQSGLGLPDESYYREEQFAAIREQYVIFLQQMFALLDPKHHQHTADDEISKTHAQNVFTVEQLIAKIHWNRVDCRDAEKTYNKYSWEECIALTTLPLTQWLTARGVDTLPTEVIISEPSFITGLASVMEKTTLTQWKSWLIWKILISFAPYLSDNFVDTNFSFYGKVLSGIIEIKPRWKRAVGVVEQSLGFAVGKKYVAQHFRSDAKQAINELVNNLIRAYQKNISELDWMTAQTKEKALEKLKQFTPKVGYPDVWKSYSGLRITSDDLIGNLIRSARYETHREVAKIGQLVDRDEWLMTPQTVNAYYYPEQNEIVFPAAILQPPFFDPHAHNGANYGGIGAVIGHEIGHGFDDQGAKYDGSGTLHDWWTEADIAEFSVRTKKLIEQYNAYEPKDLPGQHVNGALTVGENIGDLGGLSIALVAYELAEGHQLDHEQLQTVFTSWALIWRAKSRKEYQEMLLTVDPHSPPEFRCNGVVRNIDAFYQAYDVQPTDALYLAPEQRVHIW